MSDFQYSKKLWSSKKEDQVIHETQQHKEKEKVRNVVKGKNDKENAENRNEVHIL